MRIPRHGLSVFCSKTVSVLVGSTGSSGDHRSPPAHDAGGVDRATRTACVRQNGLFPRIRQANSGDTRPRGQLITSTLLAAPLNWVASTGLLPEVMHGAHAKPTGRTAPAPQLLASAGPRGHRHRTLRIHSGDDGFVAWSPPVAVEQPHLHRVAVGARGVGYSATLAG